MVPLDQADAMTAAEMTQAVADALNNAAEYCGECKAGSGPIASAIVLEDEPATVAIETAAGELFFAVITSA